MQKSETKRLDQFETGEQEKAPKTAKAGQTSYSKKFARASSQSRRRSGRAGGRRKRQRGRRDTAYKIGDLLTLETIRKLRRMK